MKSFRSRIEAKVPQVEEKSYEEIDTTELDEHGIELEGDLDEEKETD